MKNEVNRALVAKKVTRYLFLGLLMTLALNVSARSFHKGEELYVNMQQDFDWSTADAKLYLYFFGGSPDTWVSLSQENGKMYKGSFASDCSFTGVKVVRENPNKTPHQWTDPDGVWNQTGDMDIPDDWNCIDKFDDAEHRWAMYSPQTSKINAYVNVLTADEIHVCPSALGCTIALRPKLNADTTDYIYTQVTGQEWYISSNGGSSWTAFYGNAGVTRSDNDIKQKDLFTTLPNPLPAGGIYYYLHSSIPGGRHLFYIKDDASDCALSCEITAFETAVSNVNADDNTYTLDGMVAFGKASGNLVISCDGKEITIPGPKSPQAFSLHGVPAATTSGVTATATAYFTGDQSNCSKQITINVPNAKEAVEVVKVDSVTGKQFVLTPKDYDPANTYVWLANGDTIKGAPQVLVIDPYGKDSTTTYTYKEYYPASGSMDDIMENGDYEDDSWNYGTYKHKSTISDYDFWGAYDNNASQMNFYDTCSLAEDKKNNGFAVVRNANNFAPTYAKVTAKSGNNFGLFDAASGKEGANKMAWYATTADNSKLKLQQGTTYVLSFWAANINNYGEMDNAANFKFYIEDITDPAHPVKIDSSEVLDLSKPEYRNHLWHQCSKTILAKKDYNNVRISVVNLNKRILRIGNDFALDDIQFHPISTVSKVVKSQQQFVVTAHEPRILSFNPEVQPVSCDKDTYTVTMKASYENPSGKLMIKNVTRDTIYEYTLPNANFDTPINFNQNIVIKTKEPQHDWLIYFENWPTAQLTGNTVLPGFPSMAISDSVYSDPVAVCKLTTDLSFHLRYTYQQGKLHYSLSGMTEDSVRAITTDKAEQTLDLVYEGIPANGQARTLHVWFDGANSCDSTFQLPATPIGSSCEIYYDTICLGEPYNEHGFDIDNTLPVGTHYFKNAIGEELYLTVADAKDMYSKWTDVLFISNPNGQYVAYQWFKNGQPMQGETLQRLYDPSGMAGTNDLYHCQMTLVDGSVITTCPQTFDQTQRSAEASKNGNNQQQVIRRYRVSEHVYIIQTICGDRVETQKIFTSYE